MHTGRFTIRTPGSSQEWEAVRQMLREYWREFDNDTCFTSFEEEMADIETLYAGEDKVKLIAVSNTDGEVAGCVAFRTFAPGVAEMKRLYVAPRFRGEKLGRALAEAIIAEAISRGYQSMVLDTMTEMQAAQQLYSRLGFKVIPPYHGQDPQKVVCYEKKLG